MESALRVEERIVGVSGVRRMTGKSAKPLTPHIQVERFGLVSGGFFSSFLHIRTEPLFLWHPAQQDVKPEVAFPPATLLESLESGMASEIEHFASVPGGQEMIGHSGRVGLTL